MTPILSLGALAALVITGEQDTDEKPVIAAKLNEISIGYDSYTANGSRVWLRRFGRSAQGLSLRELRFVTPGTGDRPYSSLTWRGRPNEDVYAQGKVILDRGRTRVTLSQSSFGHNNDGPFPPLPSEDRVTHAMIERKVTNDIGAYVSYRADARDLQFPPYRPSMHASSATYAAGVGGKALGGTFDLLLSTRRYTMTTPIQPATLQRRVEGRYGAAIGPLNLEGMAGYTRIEQEGRGDSSVKSYALAADWDLAERMSLRATLSRDDLDIAATQSGTLRRRINSSLRLTQSWNGGSLQLGYKTKEIERKRKGPVTDTPRWTTYDARITNRFANFRVSLRSSWEKLHAGDAFLNSKPGQLQWDDRALGQIKIEGGNAAISGYASYTYRWQKNERSGTHIGLRSLALGASTNLSDRLTAYAELAHEAYRTSPSLATYFPSSTNYGLGVDWTPAEGQSLSASLNRYESRNERGSQMTLQYTRRLAADRSIELVFAPWRHEDRLNAAYDSSATFLSARFSLKF